LTFNRNRSVVLNGNPLSDREAQACAPALTISGFVRTVKALKDLCLFGLRDSGAVVSNTGCAGQLFPALS